MEVVWCMDSVNRCDETKDTENPTNDITIKPQLSMNRLTVTAIELATLEFPRVQRLIEHEWSRLYTFSGFPLYNGIGQTLRIKDCCFEYRAKLPYVLNSIVNIDSSDPSSPIFETKTPHLLSAIVELWTFSQPVQVIGLPRPVILDNVTSFTVLSATEFQVSGFPDDTIWVPNPTATDFGYLYFPPLASPDLVADILTSGLNRSFEEKTHVSARCGVFLVFYDRLKSRFAITITKEALRSPDIDYIRKAVLLPSSLLTLLGFGGYKFCFGAQETKFEICASDQPYGTTFVELKPGNYSADQLAHEISETCRSNYLPTIPVSLTKSTDIPNNVYYMSIGTDTGSIITIYVPAGAYTPESLSATITSSLAVAWPDGEIELIWNLSEMAFSFISQSHRIFSLEFQDFVLTNITSKLGFKPFRYGNKTSYKSDDNVNAQVLENITGLRTRYNNSFCTVRNDSASRRFAFNFNSVSPLPTTGTVLTPQGSNKLRITNQQQAHGLQINDVVFLQIAHQEYKLRVIEVPNGTEFIVSLGPIVLPVNVIPWAGKTLTDVSDQKLVSIDSVDHPFVVGDSLTFDCDGVNYVGIITDKTATDTFIDFSPNALPMQCFMIPPILLGSIVVYNCQIPTISMLLNGTNACAIKPMTIGFGDKDVLWSPVFDVIESPFIYQLQDSTYILLEMVYPCGSSRIEHRFKDDNRTTILGKIITLFDPFLERFYPMKATFFTGIKLEYFQFRLINPDHTLYKLHGHDWQATFRLYTPQAVQ